MKLRTLAFGIALSLAAAVALRWAHRCRRTTQGMMDTEDLRRWEGEGGPARE